MKKLIVVLVAAVLSFAAQAKVAELQTVRPSPREACMSDWTPFALTICGPVGLPWGDWNVKGLQIGIINSVYQFSGLQIGGINIADRAYGLQIGIVNVISTDDCPFLPVVNWSF